MGAPHLRRGIQLMLQGFPTWRMTGNSYLIGKGRVADNPPEAVGGSTRSANLSRCIACSR